MQRLSERNSLVLARYARYGLFAGVLFGLVIGVLVVGPHFDVWPATRSVSAIGLAGVLGALAGRLAAWLALSFLDYGSDQGTGEQEHEAPQLEASAGNSDDQSATVGAWGEDAP